jgi:response regulator RpfG family c-di-GMP phosphodiesterase
MPGMKGDEFLIDVHQRFPKTIKFMLTGHADDKAIQRAILQANVTCFKKPWSETELLSSIRNAIGQSNAEIPFT